MEILAPLALLGIGLLCGFVVGADWARRPAPLAPLSYPTPERRAGLTPPPPYLIIRADAPGAPVEVCNE